MSWDRGGPRGPSRTVSLLVRTAQHSGALVPDSASMQEGAGTPRSPMAGTRIVSLASLSGEPSLGQRHDADSGSLGPGGAASRAWHGNRAQTTGKMESVDPLAFVTSRRAGWRRVPCATAACVGSRHHGPATAVLGSLPGHGGGSGEPEDV